MEENKQNLPGADVTESLASGEESPGRNNDIPPEANALEKPAEAAPCASVPAAETAVRETPGRKEKVDSPKSTNGLVIGAAAGMVLGIVIGFLLRQMPIWIVGGILLGGAAGLLLDIRSDRRRREASLSVKDTPPDHGGADASQDDGQSDQRV